MSPNMFNEGGPGSGSSGSPPSGPGGGNEGGSPPSGPGRISDRALANLFTAIPVALGAVLAVAVAISGGAS